MSFEDVYPYTRQFESGYANSTKDAGGETFRGISRVANPDWPGWAEVDHYKRELERRDGTLNWHAKSSWRKIDEVTARDRDLAALVEDRYRRNYWRPVAAHGFSDRLTGKLFDIGVNCGLGSMAKILQRAVNRLAPGSVTVDGAIGPKSRAVVAGLNEGQLLAAVVAEQKDHYERGVLKTFPDARKSFMDRAAWVPEGEKR